MIGRRGCDVRVCVCVCDREGAVIERRGDEWIVAGRVMGRI